MSLLALLVACTSDPCPECASLAKAGWWVVAVKPGPEDRAGTDRATGFEDLYCWDVSRESPPYVPLDQPKPDDFYERARVCSYLFSDWRGPLWFDGGPIVRPGFVFPFTRGYRKIIVRAPDPALASEVTERIWEAEW